MKTFRHVTIAVAAILVVIAGSAQAFDIPQLQGRRVNDYAGLFSPTEQSRLENTLAEIEKKTTDQVAILTVKDMGDAADIATYSVDVFRAWGLGQKDKDNGVLVVIAMKEHKVRIAVGYGLERVLTDAVSSVIINQTMTPLLKEKRYFEAFSQGIQGISDLLTEDATQTAPTSAASTQSPKNEPLDWTLPLFGGIALALFIAFSLWLIFGRKRSSDEAAEADSPALDDDRYLTPHRTTRTKSRTYSRPPGRRRTDDDNNIVAGAVLGSTLGKSPSLPQDDDPPSTPSTPDFGSGGGFGDDGFSGGGGSTGGGGADGSF